VRVRCAEACAPVVRAGASRKAFRLPAGAARHLTLPLRAATRRALRRHGRVRVVVATGDERAVRTLTR
jgi:hypothetical protein